LQVFYAALRRFAPPCVQQAAGGPLYISAGSFSGKTGIRHLERSLIFQPAPVFLFFFIKAENNKIR
jgi:hypothetical protein